MRVLLIQPAPFEPGRLGLENMIWLSEPVALTQLAAMIPEHEVRILDMRLEGEFALNRALLEFEPQFVGVTAMTTDCYQAKAVLQTAKDTLGPGVFTMVGGHHPTLSPHEFEVDCVDAVCLGEGEDTFREVIEHLEQGGGFTELHHIDGLHHRSTPKWNTTHKRTQARKLDSYPAPARHLIEKYSESYFFLVAGPMASMATSRGCSFDCNFCAIWEFYERKTRFLSAEAICDRLEQTKEKCVFFLDDNFLTNRGRLEKLCDEIEKRGIKKYFLTQGRTDFIADNPELMKRLRDAGLIMVLSGYESNDEDGLKALLKRNTVEKNRKAAEILHELGIAATGIFMVRPDFTEEDFDTLYSHINELGILLPIVTILTPLPGTQLFRQRYDELLTKDTRLFDLLHVVLPTKISRERFYTKLARQRDDTWPSVFKGLMPVLRKRPGFFLQMVKSTLRWRRKRQAYYPILRDPGSHLRDEVGIIDGDARISAPLPEPVVAPSAPKLVQIRKSPAANSESASVPSRLASGND